MHVFSISQHTKKTNVITFINHHVLHNASCVHFYDDIQGFQLVILTPAFQDLFSGHEENFKICIQIYECYHQPIKNLIFTLRNE